MPPEYNSPRYILALQVREDLPDGTFNLIHDKAIDITSELHVLSPDVDLICFWNGYSGPHDAIKLAAKGRFWKTAPPNDAGLYQQLRNISNELNALLLRLDHVEVIR